VGKGFTEIVFPHVGMGIDMDEMKVRIDPQNLFDNWKGDEVVPSKEDRKFLRPEDLLKSLPDPSKGLFFISKRQFQISHIMNKDSA
jgi:hypothetical protein